MSSRDGFSDRVHHGSLVVGCDQDVRDSALVVIN
jgi:hypothetical protein